MSSYPGNLLLVECACTIKIVATFALAIRTILAIVRRNYRTTLSLPRAEFDKLASSDIYDRQFFRKAIPISTKLYPIRLKDIGQVSPFLSNLFCKFANSRIDDRNAGRTVAAKFLHERSGSSSQLSSLRNEKVSFISFSFIFFFY